LIGTEYIYYGGVNFVTATTGKFVNCVRGYADPVTGVASTAAEHANNAAITYKDNVAGRECIRITNLGLSGYNIGFTPNIIDIDNAATGASGWPNYIAVGASGVSGVGVITLKVSDSVKVYAYSLGGTTPVRVEEWK